MIIIKLKKILARELNKNISRQQIVSSEVFFR